MADNVFIHDSADKVPPPAPGRHPLTPISGADFDRAPRRRWPVQAWIVLTAVLAAVLLWLGYRLDAALRDLFARYPWAGDVLLWLLVLAVGLAVAVGLVALAARAWLSVQHARVLRTRHGVPVDVVQQMQRDPYLLEAQAIALETTRAPYLAYPNLSTLSQPAAPKAAEAPALPEPGLQPAPDALWRAWLGDAPHLLISGPTNAGKTTLARALLADASDRSSLLIVDPHDAVGKWPLEAIGGGRDYEGIYQAIDGLLSEMDTRFKALRQGETHFVPVTVLIDEAPAVALDDPKRWTELVSRLTSEARKTGIRLVILGQSHLVRDLGLSTLVRRNLGLVALGPQALDLVNDERDARRRAQLVDLLRGQDRAAAFAYRGEVQVLDVSNVPALAARPFTPRAWVPSVPPGDDTGGGTFGGNGSTLEPGNEAQHDATFFREALVVSLKRAGRTREEIRQELQAMGLGLRNTEYSDILARNGLS